MKATKWEQKYIADVKLTNSIASLQRKWDNRKIRIKADSTIPQSERKIVEKF